MSQKKKIIIRDAFEEEADASDAWFTVSVSNSNTYKMEEVGTSKTPETIIRSNSHPARRKRSGSNRNALNLALSAELLSSPLFVATASTTSSPYSSPRASVTNLEPQRLLQRSDSNGVAKSPSSSSATSPVNSLRKSAPLPANFIPPPPSTPHPSTIKRPSASPLATTPLGSPKTGGIFNMEDDNDIASEKSTYRVEILHIIVAQEHESKSALLTRSASTAPRDDLSLRNLLHPLLPEAWHLCGMQRKNNALYCVVQAPPALDRLVYIEETWQVINEKDPIDTRTFCGKNAILLACSVTSLVATTTPVLTFHDTAIDCLAKLYKQAVANHLNPFLVFLNGKTLKLLLRQQIARHFFSIGFDVCNLHWHGLSNTADCKFTKHLADKWNG